MKQPPAKGQLMQAKFIERVVADLRSQSYGRDGRTGDADFVDAFVARRDQAAFAALVHRHGPMVLGVCRRILGHAQDAEDAFQAVFLVLARKAHTVRPRAWIGNWLYGVAVRTALKARGLRRRRREYQVLAMPPQPSVPIDDQRDVQEILDEEIARLPDKYRLAVVLCDLEEQTRADAARQLGIPEGTLSSRLSTARRKLARRLQVRGVTLAAGGVALLLAENAGSAAVPHNLLANAVQTASATATTSTAVANLAKGVITAMFLSKLKQASTVALLLVAVLALGTGWGQLKAQPDAGPAAPPVATADADESAHAQQVKPPPKLDQPPAGAHDAMLGTWRILRIDVRPDGNGPGGATGQLGGRAVGAGPVPAGSSFAFDGAVARAFLHLTENTAVYANSGRRIVYRVKLGKGTIDWTQDDPDSGLLGFTQRKGIYVVDSNQLRLYFGGDTDTRPKTAKEASETWTLMRQPSRQEIYQKLDNLQGVWNVVSGEYNGEALLPREINGVILSINDDRWQMSSLKQPAQPDAVPVDYFDKPFQFVLDADGLRSILVLRPATGKAGSSEARVLYELKGDELKVCWHTRSRSERFRNDLGQPREAAEPVHEFKTTPGSEHVLFILRRRQTQPEQPKDESVPPMKKGEPVSMRKALFGIADAQFDSNNFSEALHCYQRLQQHYPKQIESLIACNRIWHCVSAMVETPEQIRTARDAAQKAVKIARADLDAMPTDSDVFRGDGVWTKANWATWLDWIDRQLVPPLPMGAKDGRQPG